MPGVPVELGCRERARRAAVRLPPGSRGRLRRHAGGAAGVPARQPLPAPDPQGDPRLRGGRQAARGRQHLRAPRQGRPQLETIAPGRSLPLCYFRAPAMDYALPVHEEGGDLVCPVLGGAQAQGRRPGRAPEPVVAPPRPRRLPGLRARSPRSWSSGRATCAWSTPAAVIRCLDAGALDADRRGHLARGPRRWPPRPSARAAPRERRRAARRRRPRPPPSARDVIGLLRYLRHRDRPSAGDSRAPGPLRLRRSPGDLGPHRGAHRADDTRLVGHLDGGEPRSPCRSGTPPPASGWRDALEDTASPSSSRGDADSPCEASAATWPRRASCATRVTCTSSVHQAPAEALDPGAIWSDPESPEGRLHRRSSTRPGGLNHMTVALIVAGSVLVGPAR